MSGSPTFIEYRAMPYAVTIDQNKPWGYLLGVNAGHYNGTIDGSEKELAKKTRLVFVGLTPGFRQVALAAQTFTGASPELRADDASFSDCLRERVSFAGTMRTNLCGMLDALGVPELFGITQSAAFFERKGHDVAMMSALPYPVVVGEQRHNFSGCAGIEKKALLREVVSRELIPRLRSAPHAVIVPLGIAATRLTELALILADVDLERIILGFPHPSGANVSRNSIFKQNFDQLKTTFRLALS